MANRIRFMKELKSIFFAGVLLLAVSGCSEKPVAPDPSPEPTPPPTPVVFSNEPVQEYELVNPTELITKECYFLSLLRHLPEMKAIVSNDSFLCGIEASKYSRLTASSDMNGKFEALSFTADEISKIGSHLESLWGADNAWDRLATQHLAPSGCYYFSKSSSAANLIRAAWAHDAQVVNMIVQMYGSCTRSVHCDSDARTASASDLSQAVADVAAKASPTGMFSDLATAGMFSILQAHGRHEEPTLFEPMKTGCNRTAVEALATTDFSKFDYSSIIVLGCSTDETCFHQEAKDRCDYAFAKWKNKKAPFIIVTGGRVRPFKTKENEADLMKKYLLEKGVPESVIIMEPNARHTPTNFRNVSRVLWRYGFPFEKEALMVMQTSIMETVMETEAFRTRCNNEFGYMPVTFKQRLDDRSKKLLPSKNSLTLGSVDPLDP